MLMVLIIFVFLYLNQRISKKEIYTILLSILIVLPLVYSSFSPNIFGLNEVSEDISEAFSPITNCTEYFESNPRSNLEYSDSEVCVYSNIEWRLTLWQAAFNNTIRSNNNLFRNTFGENIVQTLYDEELIPKYMYYRNIDNGLRNLHNSFLTLFYRIGLIPSLFIFSIFIYYLSKLKRFEWFMFLILIQTFFDPILDGPVFSIPYYWILFYQIRKNMAKLNREID